MGPLFESPPRPLLTLDMRPFDRYGTHPDFYTVTPLHRRLPATKQPRAFGYILCKNAEQFEMKD